jgi:hypothetical protein
MDKRKRTFTDPKTGEEIESTALARWGAGLAFGPVAGIVVGLYFGLGVALIAGPGAGLIVGLVVGPVVGLYLGLIDGLSFGLDGAPFFGPLDSFTHRVHNGLAWQQHRHRQRVLERKRGQAERLRQRKRLEAEWAGVPRGAISRARPPDRPEPTAASLSLAASPEAAAPRLTAGVDTVTAAEKEVIAAREPL